MPYAYEKNINERNRYRLTTLPREKKVLSCMQL
jgi:hypothetical protein